MNKKRKKNTLASTMGMDSHFKNWKVKKKKSNKMKKYHTKYPIKSESYTVRNSAGDKMEKSG